jgi:AcrR family transcriptional regulator
MSEEDRRSNPLGARVDALLRRHRDPAARASDVPVLTEVVDDEARRRPAVAPEALEALARELERAVLARLGPEVERVIEQKLARVLSGLVGQSVDGMRAELTQSVTQMVREAVAASVARALAPNSAPSEKK